MELSPVAIALAFAVVLLVYVHRRTLEAKRADFIRKYTLPQGLFEKLREKRPSLSLKDCQLVGHALRQYFLTYLRSGFKEVAMPSQVVDDLWHDLILYTRNYELFCRHAFGRFLHHTPAVAMRSVKRSNEGLRRCWWFACLEENINPRKPTRLPLLFAIDQKLRIEGGFVYRPECGKHRDEDGAPVHCGGDLGRSCSGGSGCSGGGHGGDAGGDGCSGGGGCGGGGD